MGGGISGQQLKQYKEADPHISSYLDCQSRAFMKGLRAAFVGAGAVYIGCYVINKKMPLTPAMMFIIPVCGSMVVAYSVTRMETKKCQKMWLALEEKHTALTDMKIT